MLGILNFSFLNQEKIETQNYKIITLSTIIGAAFALDGHHVLGLY